jgi:threonine synthase
VDSAGDRRIKYKLESLNPSGSYKDRFAAGQVEHLRALGQRVCLVTSSGNTGAALATYAARYGIRPSILVSDSTPAGKLLQMRAHGARVVRVPGFTTDPVLTARVMDRLRGESEQRRIPLVVSAYRYCPEGMARVEEIGRELPAGAHVFVPAGSGGFATAVCRGMGRNAACVYAVQAAGSNTIVAAWERGTEGIAPVESTTRISGLSVPFDIDASLTVRTLRECGGKALTVTDGEIYRAQAHMMAEEGIYAEPAGAAALAGVWKARMLGWLRAGDEAVCIVSGHGFKDPESAESAAPPLERMEEATLWERLFDQD